MDPIPLIGRRAFTAALLAGLAGCAASPAARTGAASTDRVFELRNYVLIPGRRDDLIALFEREFVESQEAVGARIVATFRDVDAPDHFVWIRSFADMPARLHALQTFYGGPVWKANREAANATMIDTDDVYLLRPLGRAPVLPSSRPAVGLRGAAHGTFVIDVFDDRLETRATLDAALRRDRSLIAAFATETTPNDFTALPVHADRVLVAIRRSSSAHERAERWPPALAGAKRTLRLVPTDRSLLR